MGKGSAYERDFCRRLSLWWSEGKRDDLFWRSSMSGGRATIRGRQGKTTAGHYGDIVATDAAGLPFLKYFTLELKRGYGKTKCSLSDLLDVPKDGKVQELGSWIKQARKSARLSQSPYWMIVHKKDRREEIIYLPGETKLSEYFDTEPILHYRGPVRIGKKVLDLGILAVRSETFFDLEPGLFRD